MSKSELPSRQSAVRDTALNTAHARHIPASGAAVSELHTPHMGSAQLPWLGAPASKLGK